MTDEITTEKGASTKLDRAVRDSATRFVLL